MKEIREIRLGTIGSGVIVHSMLDCVAQTDGIRLEAVYSRTGEKGRELAGAYGAEKVCTDLEELFADEQVNFVYVASPNSLHYRQVKAALEHGKNVICEKPFCTRSCQVTELIGLARSRGLFLIDATPTAFLPNLEILKGALARIGRVRLVLSCYSQYSSRYDQVLNGEMPNVFSPAFAGGCLQDINYYNIYLNVALFGKPDAAVYYPNLCPTGVDSSGIAVLRYPGFVSECAGAKDTWGVNSVQIQGEKGFIYIENGSNGLTSIRVTTKEKEETLNAQPNPNRWQYEVENLTKMVLAGDREEAYRRLETTRRVIEVIEEIRKPAGILFGGETQLP